MRFSLLCLVSVSFLLSPLAECGGGLASLNDDLLGLIVFKADLHDPLGKLASWNEDDNVACGWAGVECNRRTNRVTALSLDGYSLSGKIGRGLLQLRYLQKLSLARNNLSGELNPLLSQLDSLRSIDLSHNNLSGAIPGEFFGQCSSLRSVSFAGNGFAGEIPRSIGSCISLVALNLSSNRLSGHLPAELSSLSALRSLDLSSNALSGEMPGEIYRLRYLRVINLAGNRLSGHVQEEIGNCLLLKSIDLSGNSFTGGLPATMQRLSSCSYLSLSSNSFSGEVPEWIGQMKNLEFFNGSGNLFSGWIPASLGNLKKLKRIDFSHNNLTGRLPESLNSCKSLLDVDLSDNSLSGRLPLWISVNKSQTLEFLDLSSNTFSGEIPAALGSFMGLRYLNLSSNMLSGSIPARIAAMKSLEVLDLSGNQVAGSIPAEIGEAISMKDLRLERNSLTGRIPAEIGNCSSLVSLILSKNNLTGEIPPALANLTALQTVDLAHNSLRGTLPAQLSNLPHLLSFNISYNLFSGDLPSGNFFNSISPSSLSGNPNLCAGSNHSCPRVLPKPIVLNPNSSSNANPTLSSDGSLRHKKIIFSISSLIAIGAAAAITLGVIAISILNMRVQHPSTSHSAALPLGALSEEYYSHSPDQTDANSGMVVMFSGHDPDFSTGAHAILNKDCELGRGGFGTVYRTLRGDGRHVAIKKLNVSSLVKSQEDFEKEIKKLGKVRHPNLVDLEGYYWTSTLQLLIYEFVSGGSLYKHLHESVSGNPLLWQERFNLILGIARSLAYLHQLNIIHYNLKSSNIMIDDMSGEAKVADYGLAKLLPMLDRYVLSSKIQSALGYMAPEFACRTVKITDKCDVYGFGVLALEIVTGRRPVEYMEDDVVVLCDVVRSAVEDGRVEDCVDGRVSGKFPVDEAVPVLKVGLLCTAQVPSNRPEMSEVVKILESIRCPQE